ncbi:MAG TPA: hypothetical protein VFM18_17685 [Methanosarcina sp.]|nr:hypothetical protein [Methanosarcina sp.]
MRNIIEQAYASKLADGTGTVPFAHIEHFAMLIVQECIGVVTDTTNDSEWDGYNEATACAIREHFGIK